MHKTGIEKMVDELAEWANNPEQPTSKLWGHFGKILNKYSRIARYETPPVKQGEQGLVEALSMVRYPATIWNGWCAKTDITMNVKQGTPCWIVYEKP